MSLSDFVIKQEQKGLQLQKKDLIYVVMLYAIPVYSISNISVGKLNISEI